MSLATYSRTETPADSLSRTLHAYGIDHWTEDGAVIVPQGTSTTVVRPSGNPAQPWTVATYDGPPAPATMTATYGRTTAALARELSGTAACRDTRTSRVRDAQAAVIVADLMGATA